MIQSKSDSLPQILICDDDSLFHLAVKSALKGIFAMRSAFNGDEALAILKKHSIDLVLLDVQMREPGEGLEYIERLREEDPDLAIIMTSGLTDFPTVREALRLGATDYISKSFDFEELPLILQQALDRRSLLRRKDQQNFEVASSQQRHQLVGESPSVEKLRHTLGKYRNGTANVLIHGETGTGKEVFARQLRSTLNDNTLAPFITIDSATIQSTMAESILFGHEKGAFTGADRATKGIFEEAHGGIVYFDEIGNMPLDIQAKLLRVLQEKEVVRLGSAKPIPLEFRVVCATNKNLETEVKEGRFKDDLFQRINVLPITIPPLRERKSDIPLLLEHFVKIHRKDGARLRFSDSAVELLQAYPWPGNIRELGNLVSYLVTMAEGDLISEEDLPQKVRDGSPSAGPISSTSQEGFYPRMTAYEASLLRAEFARHEGNVGRMAEALEMDRSNLYAKLKSHKILGKKSD